jgi:hypothetical protein
VQNPEYSFGYESEIQNEEENMIADLEEEFDMNGAPAAPRTEDLLPSQAFVMRKAVAITSEKRNLLSVMMGLITEKAKRTDSIPDSKMLTFSNIVVGMQNLNKGYSIQDISRIVDAMIEKNGYVRFYPTPAITFYGLTARFWTEVREKNERRNAATGT